MPKVENAIIMAAGLGTRMRPLTNKIPKPLVKVNGQRMIETIITGLHQEGINDITIVTGYLADKFDYLVTKYPGVKLINNPYYQKYNNLSSLYVARHKLKNTIILDGDQLIKNIAILDPYFKESGYAGTWVNTSQIFPSISNVTFSSRLSFVIVFGTIPVARCKFALLIFQSIKQFLELVIK